MNKSRLFIVAILLLISCMSATDDWKELDLIAFKISIPKEWNYKQAQGEDSFVGEFTTLANSLKFDCSNMGYANSLIPTETEYLNKDYLWKPTTAFYKVGVIYTANFNVKNARAEEMKKRGITDSTLVKVEADPSYETKKKIYKPTSEQIKKYPRADYIAELTYRDSTIVVPIEIPIGIKSHNIKIDTTDKYIVKTIWPKVPGKGMTGIYIHSRSSRFNFQMSGVNLSQNDQEFALKVFRTIKFKK